VAIKIDAAAMRQAIRRGANAVERTRQRLSKTLSKLRHESRSYVLKALLPDDDMDLVGKSTALHQFVPRLLKSSPPRRCSVCGRDLDMYRIPSNGQDRYGVSPPRTAAHASTAQTHAVRRPIAGELG
jgi:hypothetical protein